MPKFEKADANTIRIIVEKANDVPLSQLVDNRKKILEQKEQLRKDLAKNEEMIDQTIKNIDEILEEAKKLGITVKTKNVDLVDMNCKIKDEDVKK